MHAHRELDEVGDAELGSGLSLIGLIEGSAACTTPFDTHGGVALFTVVTLYTFIGLAIVCDEYFCPSLEIISEALHLSEDVAGATFMAAGSSAPELFTALVTIYVAPGDQGVGTIVGSAIFNLCVIVGLSCLCAGAVLDLFWWPLTRDSVVYGVSIVLMLIFMADGEVTSVEAATMTLLYVVYLLIMVVNPRIVRWIAPDQAQATVEGESAGLEMSPVRARSDSAVHLEDGEKATPESIWGESDLDTATHGTDRPSKETSTSAPEAAPAEEEEEKPGCLGKIYGIIAKPMELILYFTIPDCRTDFWKRAYFLTFLMSILWIGGLSFIMVDFASRAACVLGVSELVIGLVVLSVGTSVPDALSSVIVAKQGQGNMAVCNALGSNIFNILLGLGLPWWLNIVRTKENQAVPGIREMGEPLGLLLFYLALFIGIIYFGRWKLSPKVGWALLFCQLAYTTWTLLRHLPTKSPLIGMPWD